MNHAVVLPLLLPLIAGAALVVLHRAPLSVRRGIGLLSTLLMAVAVIALGLQVEAYGLMVYQVGNWPSFAGVALLADPLAVLMLGLLVVLALAAQLLATGGEDRHGLHFQALFQFQLFGLAGAFLTHDLFNLFVFFEVLLAASYGLLLHGQGGERLRQGLHYVVLNVLASALFLFAIGTIYAAAGSLNMSDLSVRIGALAEGPQALAMAGGALLLVVFGLKSALLPLSFWLPRTYAAAPATSALLFALMTKLGLYALIRTNSLMFGTDAGALAGFAWPWLFWAGAAGATFAAIAALAARRLRPLVGQLVVGSAGVVAMAVGMGTQPALAAALFYLVNSTLATAAFFLLADWIRRQRNGGDVLFRAGRLEHRGLLGALFLFLAVAVIGLPPLGGFLGKVLLLAYAEPSGQGVVLWSVVLGASVLNLVALARSGSRLFWQPPLPGASAVAGSATGAPGLGERLALALLLTALVGVAVLASPLARYAAGAAGMLQQPGLYSGAVLGLDPLPSTVPQ